MNRVPERIYLVFLLLVFVVFILLTIQMPLAARRTPLLMGVGGLAATVVQLVIEFRANLNRESTKEFNEKTTYTVKLIGLVKSKEVQFFLWLIIFLLLIYFMGFTYAIPIFIFSMIRFQYGERLATAVMMAVGSGVVYQLVFVNILRITAYEGLLGRLLSV